MAKVLLIEDDVQQILVTSFALRRGGHRVHVAVDGARGLQAAQALKPDIVVCDVVMPGMSGFEVVTALRQMPELIFTPVVMLTAMTESENLRQGMTSGADDYLTKPCAPEDLCRAVDAALERRGQQRQTVAGVISGVVGAAVEQERQALALRYEVRLTQEVSARWDQVTTAQGDLHYAQAILVYMRLSGLEQSAAEPAHTAAERLRAAHQAARDTLYLFGAERVISHLKAFVGIFPFSGPHAIEATAGRAVNASFAMARHMTFRRRLAIGLHCGGVDMVSVNDPLHGETGHTISQMKLSQRRFRSPKLRKRKVGGSLHPIALQRRFAPTSRPAHPL